MPGMLKRVETSPFDLLAWLEGETEADGVFEDRSGHLKRRFRVEMTGTPSTNGLNLDERFVFDDGERLNRVWRLERDGPASFTGTCEDAVSVAKGRFEMGAAYLSSELRVAVGSRSIAMRFSDAFYEIGNGMVLNRSTVSKWGMRIGQVLILFRKPSQLSP